MIFRNTSANKSNEINNNGSYLRTSAGLPQRFFTDSLNVCGGPRKSFWKSNDFNGRGGLAEVRKCLPYLLKSLNMFAAAEFPHTPCAHFRALEARAKRRVRLMGGTQ